MNNFFDYFNEDIGRVFEALVEAIGSCFNFLNFLFNFPMRMEIIREHTPGFTTGDWVMLLIVNVALIAACGAIIFLVVKLVRKIFFSGISRKEYERMSTEVLSLQKYSFLLLWQNPNRFSIQRIVKTDTTNKKKL